MPELIAGLRRYTKDPGLQIVDIKDQIIPHQRSSMSRIRGMRVFCKSTRGQQIFDLVVKESFGADRAGAPGGGWRERSLYSTMMDYIPIKMPQMVAADPEGQWIILSLLPGGIPAEHWGADEYELAVDHLAALHDQFWGLSEDLENYNWLARPLEVDFSLAVSAANSSLQKLRDQPDHLLHSDYELFMAINNIVSNAEQIARPLRQLPGTLLHGDYWPGNLMVYPDGILFALDWQMAAIGPAVLDLMVFIQESRWWFKNLPITISEIVNRYRQNLKRLNGVEWSTEEWELLLDHALLWTFLSNWIEVLGRAPNSIIQVHKEQLESIWLEPIRRAAFRRLKK
jgi:thiamine kinase-like enzyme